MAAVLVAAVLVAGSAGVAAPAWADQLIEASPAPGSQVRSAPGSVALTFDSRIVQGTGVISVSGPDGRVDVGVATSSGATLSANLPATLAEGRYTVRWQAIFQVDGFEADSYRFSIVPGPAPSTTTPAPATTRPTPAATRTPAPRTESPSPTTGPAESTTAIAITSVPATTPPATPAAPNVKVISATGTGSLPSPPVLWGLIAVLGLAGLLARRWRRGA